MQIKHLGNHPDLITTPLSSNVIATTTPTAKSAHSVTIEVYEAKDFIKEAKEDGATIFMCIVTNPTSVQMASVARNTPSTSMLPDSIPTEEHEDLAQQLPQEYHKFHNIFTGTAASYLPPHRKYNL